MSGGDPRFVAQKQTQSALFPVDFQVQVDFLAAVKTRNGARRRLGGFFFRMPFVIRIGVKSAEPIAAGVIGIVAPDGIGARVFQENNAAGDGTLGLVHDHAADGAELCFALFVLSPGNSRKKRKRCQQTSNASLCVHFLPPAAGCIRNTTSSTFPPFFASIERVCAAKPLAWTTISYSEP